MDTYSPVNIVWGTASTGSYAWGYSIPPECTLFTSE